MGFLAGGVEAFGPAFWVIISVGSGDDVARDAHVEYLSNACGVEALIDEVFSHAGTMIAFVAAEHEGASRGATGHALAVGSVESHAFGGKGIDIRSLYDGVAVAAKGACFEVVRNDEKDIFDFGLGTACERGEGDNGKDYFIHCFEC